MEVGVNSRMYFLNTTIIIDNQRIIFDTHNKATFSGRFFNFYSNHPLCHRRGTIINFLEKIFYLKNIHTLAFNKKI